MEPIILILGTYMIVSIIIIIALKSRKYYYTDNK